ncbi:MAG: hypothetical protein J6D11_00845 [Clostridia bacterium]|nr:hypothetical protein [Clostridia bacterium]
MREIFFTVLNMSITASYVILAILLVRLFLRKLPKKFSYALWSVAAFRLCVPVSFTSIISFFNIGLFDMTDAQKYGEEQLSFVPSNAATNEFPRVSVGIPTLNSAINEAIPESKEVIINGVTKTRAPLEIAANIALAVWIIGFTALLIYGVITFVRAKLAMRTAVRANGNVYASDVINTPFVLGFIKPRIYVPFGLEREAFGYVLAHEQYHIKRLDHIVKPIAFLILCVHWFNPLCWLAFILMSRDQEMSCDEKVLSMQDGIGGAYSETLLSFAVGKRFPAPSPLSFGESSVKSRIKNALKFKKPRFWMSIVAVVLCIATVAACAANPTKQGEDDIYKEISVEGRTENLALWEYSPYLSSRLPWFPISFNFKYTKIEVNTPKGNISASGKRYGTELVLYPGEELGWHPTSDTVKIEEFTVYSNTTLNFTVYDESEIIYKGKIVIASIADAESKIGKIYGAYVEGCEELTMTQGNGDFGYGGVVKLKSEIPDNSPAGYIKGVCTKDGVDEFFAAAKNIAGAGAKENCYNVTPLEVSASTDIEIFKFSDTCAAFALIDGKAYPICEYFGGMGFINAVPCNFDGDENYDLLVSSAWGSGMSRSEISVFNTKTKETTVLYNTLMSDDPIMYLAVFPVGTPSSKPLSRLSDIADVYSVEIMLNDGNSADISYVPQKYIGTVKWENGNVVFLKDE